MMQAPSLALNHSVGQHGIGDLDERRVEDHRQVIESAEEAPFNTFSTT
jgi:hypothetical protein